MLLNDAVHSSLDALGALSRIRGGSRASVLKTERSKGKGEEEAKKSESAEGHELSKLERQERQRLYS